MTTEEFWNSQSPTDENKMYVSDFYATKFAHHDLFRFAAAYASAEVERRVEERDSKANETRQKKWDEFSNKIDKYFDETPREEIMKAFGIKDTTWMRIKIWFRSRMTEGGKG